jgi:peptide/nickel transport system permease protein
MTDATAHAHARSARAADGRSLWREAGSRLLRNPGAVAGIVVLVLLVLIAVSAPWITSYDPIRMDPVQRLRAPSAAHWFGTDSFGRDIFARVVFGARVSLQVGFVAVAIALGLGATLGMIAGYAGGSVEGLIMRIVDVTLAFPGILLALAIIAILGPDLVNAMIAVGISAAPTYARVARGSVKQTKELPYIEAARQSGARDWRIVVFHVVPNVIAPIVVVATLGIGQAIIAGASLSFLGLGARPPTAEWGLMLSEGRHYMRHAWWIATFPGLAIMLTVLSVNLLGDGLRDAIDPRLR